MSMTDTIADMLTRIRNAQKSKLLSAVAPHSKMKMAVLSVLKDEGYISDYREVKVRENISSIEIELKYSRDGKPAIQEIKKVSKPGKREYSAVENLKEYYSGMGVYVLSTSHGVISDRKARELGIGGEVVCKVF
jgi:small subunit ribosomal protein S8